MVTLGRRIYPNEDTGQFAMAPGDYCKDKDGRWWIRAPRRSMGVLDSHTIIEHADKTITVSPSILSDDWHGFLEQGVWREV